MALCILRGARRGDSVRRSKFETEQWLPYPVEVVFAFFADPRNLPQLMPDWQKGRIEEAAMRPPPALPEGAKRLPGTVAGDGTRLWITFRALPGVPVRLGWEARIEDFAWNKGFCDTQLRGPFAYWHHCHRVTAAEGGTLLRDEVEFSLRADPVSRLVLPVARTQMEAMFAFRHKRTEELMGRFAAAVAG